MTHGRVSSEPRPVEMIVEGVWAPELAEFTRRNLGRRGTLEIDDLDIDAQAQVFDFPLAGVDWDSHDREVEIMLGDTKRKGRHLTHSVSGVTSIGLMRDEHGRDVALRIAHGMGLTVFTFTDV
jgi:hypothetical protein